MYMCKCCCSAVWLLPALQYTMREVQGGIIGSGLIIFLVGAAFQA
jgi:hypothetical protein